MLQGFLYSNTFRDIALNRSQISILAVVAAFLISAISTPYLVGYSDAETVNADSDIIGLYFSEPDNSLEFNTMRPTADFEDRETIVIGPTGGTSETIATKESFATDLEIDPYNSAAGDAFKVLLYAEVDEFSGGPRDIEIKVFDSDTPDGTLESDMIAYTDSCSIKTREFGAGDPEPNGEDENECDIPISGDSEDCDGSTFGSSYTFCAGNYLVMEIINEGDFDVYISIDSEETPSHLLTIAAPVKDITIDTFSLDLNSNSELERIATTYFQPNLPDNKAKMFFSGTVTDAFGGYDIRDVLIKVLDSSDDSEIWSITIVPEISEDGNGIVIYGEEEWGYYGEVSAGNYIVHAEARTHASDPENEEDYYYSVTSPITMEEYGAYVYSDVTEQGITEEGYVDYEVSVVNSGDNSDSFEITADGAPSGWSVNPLSSDSGSLSAGQEYTTSFRVTLEDSNTNNDIAVILFTAHSNGDDDVSFSLTTTTTIGEGYDVELLFENGETTGHEALAGDWFDSFSLKVMNKGLSRDTIELSSTSSNSLWGLEFDYAGDRSSILKIVDMDAKSNVTVTVWINPSQAGDQDTNQFTIKGESDNMSDASHSVSFYVERYFEINLDATSGSEYLDMSAGGTREVSFTITSNVEGTNTFELSTENLPSGWSSDFDGLDNGDTITLNEGQTEVFKLSVTLSQQAVYTSTGYEIRVKVIHQDDSSIFSQEILTFNIQKITTFQVIAQVTKAIVAPGESFIFTLEIDNQGNVDSTFVLSALSVPSGWRVTFPDGSSIPISAGSTSSVQIEIASSADSKNGESEIITIVVSRTDADGTSEQSKDFTVDVEDAFGGRLMSTLEDTWYVFVFLILVIIVGLTSLKSADSEEEDWDNQKNKPRQETVATPAPPIVAEAPITPATPITPPVQPAVEPVTPTEPTPTKDDSSEEEMEWS